MRVRRGLPVAAIVFGAVLVAAPALAQLPGLPKAATQAVSPQAPAAQAAAAAPEDPLGRTTPYGAVMGFLRAADRGDFQRAGEFLDTPLAGTAKADLARRLSNLINTYARISLDTLSRDAEGAIDDGMRRSRERVGTVTAGDDNLDLLLDRVQSGSGPPVWIFSTQTLQQIPAFEAQVSSPIATWLEGWLPGVLVEKTLFGSPAYRWIALPLLLLTALAVALLAGRVVLFVAERLLRFAPRRDAAARAVEFRGPVRLLAFAAAVAIGGRFGLTLLTRYFWAQVATLLTVAAVTWAVLRVADLVARRVQERLTQRGLQHRLAVVRLFTGVGKFLVVTAGALLVLGLQGVDLTAVVAGLGIGGLALAFAAQKTIENLFGTVMIVTDQPVRVGDFCKVGDTLGTIEDIGLRSTRIRTLDRTLVAVPNGQVASMVLENFALRDLFWFHHVIGLRYETTAAQMQGVLDAIRRLLREHPQVDDGSARARFIRFGGSSLDVELFAYVRAADYAAFLEAQEALLVRIMAAIEACGTAIAFPSQTTYLAADTGTPVERLRATLGHAPPNPD